MKKRRRKARVRRPARSPRLLNPDAEVGDDVAVQFRSGEETLEWVLANAPKDILNDLAGVIEDAMSNIRRGNPPLLAMTVASSGFFALYCGQHHPRLCNIKMLAALSILLDAGFRGELANLADDGAGGDDLLGVASEGPGVVEPGDDAEPDPAE